MTADPIAITRIDAAAFAQHAGDLAAVLHACVHAGASVNFVLPFTLDDARRFWGGKVLPALADGQRVLLIATRDGALAGTVQLDCETPPNQPHRAGVTKLLVGPAERRQGIARRLMYALEREAVARGRWLLTLDTETGSGAERLYAALGYQQVGTIPNFSKAPTIDRYDATTVMYKTLTA